MSILTTTQKPDGSTAKELREKIVEMERERDEGKAWERHYELLNRLETACEFFSEKIDALNMQIEVLVAEFRVLKSLYGEEK